MLCGTVVSEGFLGAAGERVQDPYSITIMFCHCHNLIDQRRLLFWQKTHCSDNVPCGRPTENFVSVEGQYV